MRINLTSPISLSEISETLSAKLYTENTFIDHITTDSREVCKGDIFLSLAADPKLNLKYTKEAIMKGGVPLGTQHCEYGITVNNMNDSLLSLSELFLKKLPNIKERIAITGSVGKTTTKEFLSKILAKQYKIHRSFKNYNNALGLLINVLLSPRDTEALILELGSNHRGEISALSKSIQPTLAAITCIGSSHIGNFLSEEELIREKFDIISGMSYPRLVCDRKIKKHTTAAITASCESYDSTVFLKPTLEEKNGTEFELYHNQKYIGIFRVNIGGRHMLHCLSVSVAMALEIGIDYSVLQSAFDEITTDMVRHKIIHVDNYSIFDDSYNSSFESVEADLRYMRKYNGNISALLGDIYELGDLSETIHRKIGAMAAYYGLQRLYLFGKHSNDIYLGAIDAGFNPKFAFINSDLDKPEITAKQIKDNHLEGELILFKASNKVRLYRVKDILTEERKDK